jgi:hypothetical protein
VTFVGVRLLLRKKSGSITYQLIIATVVVRTRRPKSSPSSNRSGWPCGVVAWNHWLWVRRSMVLTLPSKSSM